MTSLKRIVLAIIKGMRSLLNNYPGRMSTNKMIEINKIVKNDQFLQIQQIRYFQYILVIYQVLNWLLTKVKIMVNNRGPFVSLTSILIIFGFVLSIGRLNTRLSQTFN